MTRGPLEGIRVIALSAGAVLPDCTKILGEFGADVIKIESKQNLDFMRTTGPDINAIAGFNESNRNKRSLGVNLRTEKGKEIVKRLIKMSDIVGESFRGGVAKSLELDYENVRQFKPDIIYISTQGFGGGGPYSHYQAYGPMNSAASGLTYLWSHPDDPYPTGSTIPHPDHIAGKHAVVAILAALDYRRRTGKGQFIDMAQTEVAAALIGEAFLEYTINNRIPEPMGNRSLYAAPHGCYRCKGEDQWCAISVFTNDEWQGFCHAIGDPAWTARPEFADTPSRLRNVDELDRLVEEWTINRDAHEVMDTLQQAGVAAGVVQRAADIFNDPQLRQRGAFVEVDHPVVGKKLYPSAPFRLSEMPTIPSTPAPLFGQHTDEVCRELLEMSEEEIKGLKEEGVLEGP